MNMGSRQSLHKIIAQLPRWDTGDLRALDEELHTLLNERQREDAASPPVKAGRKVVEERQHGGVTLRREHVRCGKEGCHCAANEGHGPYWYAYYRKAGRLTSMYIGVSRINQLRRIEVLRTARNRGRGRVWFYDDDHRAATTYLIHHGLIEEIPNSNPSACPFRLTEQGELFIQNEVLPVFPSFATYPCWETINRITINFP